MYNLRYHIASLVAVFLSLSIGLLLGTIVVERGILDRQRETIVRSLQEEFRTLNAENTELSDRVASREELSADLLLHAVEGSLTDRQVLVIVGTGRVDGLAAVTDAIRLAGGSSVVMVLTAEEFGLGDPGVVSALTGTPALVGPDGATIDPATLEPDALFERVVGVLADEWALPNAQRVLTGRLAEAGVLRIDGEADPAVPVDGVVTLAALDEVPERGALAVTRALDDRGAVGVGAEATVQETGVATAAVEQGLSAIDHIGTDEGTFSLVFVLAERASGHFGMREGATAPWPR